MSSNSNSNYSPRPDWRTERNLLQNFNQVSNKKLKTISLANALKQMKMENNRAFKKMKMENDRARKEYKKKLKEMKTLREKTMKQLKDAMRLKQLKEEKKNKTNNSKPIPEPNYLPRPLGWRKTKEINKKVEKSKSLSPLRFKTRPKKNYHKTNVPNVIVQNTKRKKGGVLNSLPNEYFQNKK
tara:strand:+ start:102 stop:650 length:549 start_codon:yes stop_codon:yes gene_type:complete